MDCAAVPSEGPFGGLPVVTETPSTSPSIGRSRQARLRTVDDTRSWGARLGAILRAGDLLLLTGELGAGKTSLTQGIAQGLGVRGPITSPTFVIAREHPSLRGGPDLVHVDAYRLAGLLELDYLDLDASLEEAVTVVEWGHGVAEQLSEDYLEVTLRGHDVRTVDLVGHGRRWTAPSAEAVLDDLVWLP
jgi:tRNA threonylcarbamoyladenosine biosynthesis protein TsaE